MSFSGKAWLVGIALVSFLALIFCCISLSIVNVEGYEMAVVHTWASGVQSEPLNNGLHTIWFGKAHKVKVGTQKFTFGPNEGDEAPSIKVTCGANGGQKAQINMTINWYLEGTKVVQLYKDNLAGEDNKTNYVEIVMKRTIIGAVNDAARPKEALDIYSGEGFLNLHQALSKALMGNPEFTKRGIVITNVTLYHVELEPAYEAEIAAKQLATQSALRKKQETLAADQEALRVKATAQSIVEQKTAEAMAKKAEVVTAALAQKEQVIAKAEGDMQQAKLRGEGSQLEKEAQAKGDLALGLAEAQVAKAKRDAMYEGEAGHRKAMVEIASLQAEKLKAILAGVKVIPERSFISLMDENARNPLTLPGDLLAPVAPIK
jgi:regulator of protease activity HflC (stomatin/prohibitin superfamily)